MGPDDQAKRYDTLLAATAVLYANGQSTHMTQTAVARPNRGLELDAVVVPSWSMLTLTAAGSRTMVLTAAVSPTAVNMRKVSTMMAVVDRGQDGPLELEHVARGVAAAEAESVSPTAAFATACATGAAALSVIYGATQPLAILLVALATAVGGLLRRWSGSAGAGPLVQAFIAAVLAGAVGAAAMHLDLGASAAVVALCPAMVLVAVARILNGALDPLDLRVTLGIAQLAFGMLVLTAIAAGLILGLHISGQTLAVTAPSSSAPFIVDVLAAGVALAPGVFVFRTLAGFVEFAGHPSAQLLSSSAADLIVGTIIVAGMALGLALPMHLYAGRLARREKP